MAQLSYEVVDPRNEAYKFGAMVSFAILFFHTDIAIPNCRNLFRLGYGHLLAVSSGCLV